MTHRFWKTGLLLGITAVIFWEAVAQPGVAANARRTPNVVLILTDQQHAGMLSSCRKRRPL